MNKLTKSCILAATFFTMAFGSLSQVSAAPASVAPQNYAYGQNTYGDILKVRHKGRHHYNRHHRHHHYKKQRRHRSNRYCHYSPRRGTMVCKPRHRSYW